MSRRPPSWVRTQRDYIDWKCGYRTEPDPPPRPVLPRWTADAPRWKRPARKPRRGPVLSTTAGIVYMVRCAETGRVKIGFTCDATPAARLAKLQTGCPTRLEAVRWFAAPRSAEHDMHVLCREHRIHGEWFRPEAAALFLAHADGAPRGSSSR